MSGHRHNPNAGTQNQGNALGDRSCVRQSKLYRKYESGNDVKSLLGTSNLCWDPSQKQGAYQGQKIYDFDEHQNIVQGRQEQTFGAASRKQGSDYGYDNYGSAPQNNYSSSSNDYGYGQKTNSYSNDYSHEAPPQNYGRRSNPVGGGSGGGRPYGGDDSTDYSTSNNSYGVNNTTKSYGGGGGGAGVADYGAPPQNNRRRDSFSNDENQYRNQYRSGGGDEGGSYPMNKMSQMREQANGSNFQSRRQDTNNNGNNQQSVRTYHGGADASRSTRPW